MQLNAFQKKMLFEGLLTCAVLSALLGGLWYFGAKISSTSDSISSMRQELAVRSHSLNSLAALRSEYHSRAVRNLNTMYAYVPTEEQLINLRQEIMVLTQKSNLGLQYSFISESPASATNFGTYNFRIDMTGDYDALIGFVNTLQNFRYLSSFQSYSVLRNADKSSMSVKGTVYFREDVETPATL